VNTEHKVCNVHIVSDTAFSDLIKNGSSFFDDITNGQNMVHATLTFDSNAKCKFGAFKQAIVGRSNIQVLADSTSIIIKQCFFNCRAMGKKVILDGVTQVKKLSSEINCLRWASALMGLVYDYVDEHIGMHGSPPFSVPQMHFVKSALAITEDSMCCDAFLLEEVIDGSDLDNGEFVKYIGNGSVFPYDHLEGEAIHRAKFLSFCQHLQFIKTNTYAFVADFQGEFNT